MRPGKDYVPKERDIVWLEFTPQAGHEQSGRRPALVISPGEYNDKTGLAIFCPITSKEKGYPFEVKINIEKMIKGVILSDQVKSLDWRKRKAKYITRVSKKIMDKVMGKILLLIH